MCLLSEGQAVFRGVGWRGFCLMSFAFRYRLWCTRRGGAGLSPSYCPNPLFHNRHSSSEGRQTKRIPGLFGATKKEPQGQSASQSSLCMVFSSWRGFPAKKSHVEKAQKNTANVETKRDRTRAQRGSCHRPPTCAKVSYANKKWNSFHCAHPQGKGGLKKSFRNSKNQGA